MADTVVIFDTTDVVYQSPDDDIGVLLPANAEPIIILTDHDPVVILPATTEPVVVMEPIGPPGIKGDTGDQGDPGAPSETGIAFFVGGHMRDGETLYYAPVVGDVDISETRTRIIARIAPSVDKVFTLTTDAGDFSAHVVFGTATILAGHTEATKDFTYPGLTDGQNFGVFAPDSADPDLADIGFQFVS